MPTRGLFLLELLDFSAAFSDALPASRHGWGASLRYAHPGTSHVIEDFALLTARARKARRRSDCIINGSTAAT